jgi:hypothetical protein
MRASVLVTSIILVLLAIMLIAGCNAPTTNPPTSSPSPTSSTTAPSPTTSSSPTPTASYSQYQLAYILLDKYPDYFWCDPDYYPVAREGGEQANALAQYPTVRANQAEFSAILDRLGYVLQSDYSDSQKLAIYQEHKKITLAVQMTANQGSYRFTLAVGQGQGQRLTGTITSAGTITIISQEASFNTCPICLSEGTQIDTPQGPVAVEALKIGDLVWSVDAAGQRVAARVLKTSRTAVPADFQVAAITLEDGRHLVVSPNHPSSEYKSLGEYRVGQVLDGSIIRESQLQPYSAQFTYDLLPDTRGGLYWADGILVGSTLKN